MFLPTEDVQIEPMDRATIQRAVCLGLAGTLQPEPDLTQNHDSDQRAGREGFICFRRPFDQKIPYECGQTITIFPGLRMLSGSSAFFIAHITSTASPCSAIMNCILP